MKGKIRFILLVLLLLAIVFTGCSTATIPYLEFEATVTDIEIEPGGWASPSMAIISFDDGRVIPFHSRHAPRFVVGHKYFVRCHLEKERADTWALDFLEERVR